jgi:hypothetical protein
MDATANSTYGFGRIQPTGYDGPVSENMGNNNPTYQVTENSPTGMTVGGIGVGHHSVGHSNPMFWFLILVLIFVGYIGLGFDFSVKNLFSTKTKVGH